MFENVIKTYKHKELKIKSINNKHSELFNRLKNGRIKYYISGNKEYVYVGNKESVQYVNKNRRIRTFKNYVGSIIYKGIDAILNLKHGFIKKDKVQGKYDLLIISRNDDLKYIDFKNSIIVTFFSSNARSKIITKNLSELMPYYSNTITKMEENYIMEQFIDFKPIDKWNLEEQNKLMINLIQTLCLRGENLSFDKNSFIDFRKLLRQTNDINIIKFDFDKLKLIEKESFPKLLVHGDMNFNNVLLLNKNYYYIDFEDAFESVFYFDFLNIISEEAFNNNVIFLNKYKKGEYNEYLDKIFSSYNVKFYDSLLEEYFKIFMLLKIYQFEFKHKLLTEDQVINKYIKLQKIYNML